MRTLLSVAASDALARAFTSSPVTASSAGASPADGVGLGPAITAPELAMGVLEVEIRDLAVVGAGDHGVHVTDDHDGDLDAAGAGTPASVTLLVQDVVVLDDVTGI